MLGRLLSGDDQFVARTTVAFILGYFAVLVAIGVVFGFGKLYFLAGLGVLMLIFIIWNIAHAVWARSRS